MHNPVAWQIWGEEALALAKKHNRLLFLSVGYAACHCRSAPGGVWLGMMGVMLGLLLIG